MNSNLNAFRKMLRFVIILCAKFDVHDKTIYDLDVIADDETQYVSKCIQIKVHFKLIRNLFCFESDSNVIELSCKRLILFNICWVTRRSTKNIYYDNFLLSFVFNVQIKTVFFDIVINNIFEIHLTI